MWPFKKKELQQIDAVIEGCFHDDIRSLAYKIARLDVPAEATVLFDGTHRYGLYGKTDDFVSITEEKSGNPITEVKIEELGFCKGAVLPYRGEDFGFMLESPRSVVLRDGRIFFNGGESYSQAIPTVVKQAGIILRDERASQIYNDAIIPTRRGGLF